MNRLSPGVLASIIYLFQMPLSTKVSKQVLFQSYPYIEGVKIDDIFDTALNCKWIEVIENQILISSEAEIFAKNFDLQTKRKMLEHFILNTKPSWASLITKGRKECSLFMPVDTFACFREAELFQSTAADVVAWWDNISACLRKDQQNRFTQVGRKGELLSLKYEFNRVGQNPKWQSIESNLIGYDLLSKVSKIDSTPLCIEVKTSEEIIENASAHITRKEWNTAINSDHYLFHFWLLSKTPQLAILSVEMVKSHIPQNIGRGEWESTEIFFKVFEKQFKAYSIYTESVTLPNFSAHS